ncbi:uncharacterized protein [Oryza sativa Japonica Group]|jgi:hypothetical protein|nr:uncharacterized protein LOC4325456 isoform X1 [Oryza sativa Japonica Group]XP_015618280.1 uncharacterized protein LOC4325456 isoform X1 [Oryza sativa Japonica Group]
MGEVAEDIYTQDGTVDVKGNPATKKNTGNWRACPYILANECCERLAYYGMSTNLVNYMKTRLGQESAIAANNVTNWSGTCYITPLLGAFLADAYMGRFWTIASFMIIYILVTNRLGFQFLIAMIDGVIEERDVLMVAGFGVADNGVVGEGAGAGVRRRSVSPDGGADGGGVLGAVPDSAGHRRDQAVRVVVWRGPVRRERRGGEAEQEQLLQLVLLLHQHRRAGGVVGAGVRADARRVGVGVRHPGRRHGRRRRQLLRRHAAVQAPAARGQPADEDRAGARRVGEEVGRRGPRRRVAAARDARQGVRHRGQPQAGAHRAVRVPRQGGGGDAGGQVGGERVGVAAVHGDAGGGAEERGAAAADLGERDRVRDGVRADEHHVRPPGEHARRQHGAALLHPGGVALHLRHPQRHRLGAGVRPPHRAGGARRDGAPTRVHPAAADGHRPRHLRLLHARRRRARRRQAARHRSPRALRRQGRRAHLHLLAGAAVLHHRRRRGVHVRRAAGVLLRPGSRRHAQHVLGAVAHHRRARQLPQHAARDHRYPCHHPERRRRVDPGQPQPRPPRLLLLAARRAQPHQLRRLPRHRQLVHLQEDGGFTGRQGRARRSKLSHEVKLIMTYKGELN